MPSRQYSKPTLERVEIHPLVLLSVTDHYNRVAKDTKKRVVGCLLGQRIGSNVLDVTNSFAVPFDEEDKTPSTWFLDFNYLEDLAYMFKRVNSREKIIGWYSSGPKLKKNDIDIHKIFYQYCDEPVCCIIRVQDKDNDDTKADGEEEEELPTKAYCGIDCVQSDGRHTKEFAHIPSIITASEAEQVGVEHLLREIENISLSTLTTEVNHKSLSLNGLSQRLLMIQKYLNDIQENKLPINQDILQNLQLIFNLLPNLNKKNVIKSFQIKKNDLMLNIYIASLLRSILALDNLLENRIENKNKEDKKEIQDRKNQQKITGDEDQLFNHKTTNDKDSGKDKKKTNKK
mmetsp:Transcript_55095/g.49595  ORF Transcript_55095/g.49595 Transcript_55095/m.49595 type:complete len:344 (-) Transcript_55095:165-1196(-)